MIKSGHYFTTITLKKSFFWESRITGFRVGSIENNGGRIYAYNTKPIPVVFDSGTSLMYAPTCKFVLINPSIRNCKKNTQFDYRESSREVHLLRIYDIRVCI